MHLSSRLPKKNYDHSLDGGILSGDRKAGGASFKNQYHNTMGKRKNSREKQDQARQANNESSPMIINSDSAAASPSGVLKLPQIKNLNSPAKRDQAQSQLAVLPVQVPNAPNSQKKSPYESMKPSIANRQSLNEQ